MWLHFGFSQTSFNLQILLASRWLYLSTLSRGEPLQIPDQLFCDCRAIVYDSKNRGGFAVLESALRRSGRVVEGARLESVYTATYRGFESLLLRHLIKNASQVEAFLIRVLKKGDENRRFVQMRLSEHLAPSRMIGKAQRRKTPI